MLLAQLGVLQLRERLLLRDDFSRIWAGPRALVSGVDPYDAASWGTTSVALGGFPPDTAVYLYPPWVALALAPMGALPLPVATVVWTVGGMLAAAFAVRALLRACPPGVPWAHALVAATLSLSAPAVAAFLTGQ